MSEDVRFGQLPCRVTPMTAAQRAQLARLRISHPRARVTVSRPNRQPEWPLVRVKMKWPTTTIVRWIWLTPEGQRLDRRINVRDRQKVS